MSSRFSIREQRFQTTSKRQRSNWLEGFKPEGDANYVLEAAMASRGFDFRYLMQFVRRGIETEMRPGTGSFVNEASDMTSLRENLRTLFERPDESDWTDAKNDRRCELIDKEIEGTLLPAEKRELEELQRQMLAYRRKVAPLPLKEAQRLHQQLLKKAAEQVD